MNIPGTLLSTGDAIALISVTVVATGQLIAWQRAASKQVAIVATEAAHLRSLTENFDRLTHLLEKLSERQSQHEVDCSGRWGETHANHNALVAAQKSLMSSVENLTRQVANLALGLAPHAAVYVPASGRLAP